MSTKKMHPPAMVHTNGPLVVSKGATLIATGGGKATKDRQNVENIVPSFHQNGSNGNESQANGKKVSNKTSTMAQPAAAAPAVAATPAAVSANAIKTVPANVANGSSVISTLNSANRRKSNRNNSPNRKRREQQNIFNSLRAYNVKILPSEQTAAQEDYGKGEKQSAGGGVLNSAGSGISSSGEASKANSERSSSVSSTATSGSVSSSVSSNTSSNSSSVSNSSSLSDSTKDINGLLKGKKRAVATCSTVAPAKEPISTVVVIAQNVKKKEEPGQPNEANGEAKRNTNTPVIGGLNGTGGTCSKGEKKVSVGNACSVCGSLFSVL